jgi:Peptidase family M23
MCVPDAALLLDLPFRGTWMARNSPARRVPSHGTHLYGTTYAIDFILVDAAGRSAATSDWRSLVSVEPPERFLGFGAPILAPISGTVVASHDGEPDHVARRSQFALVPYALSQPSRVRQGVASIAGNYVILATGPAGPYVGLVHFRRGSVGVRTGNRVIRGDQLAECGNSGNSTQPHVHVQVTDSADMATAHGIPMAFRNYRGWRRGARTPQLVNRGIPEESEIVEAVPSS